MSVVKRIKPNNNFNHLYKNSTGKFYNPQKTTKKQTTRLWAWVALFSFLVLILAAIVAGMVVFKDENKSQGWSSEKIILQIESKDKIKAGEELTYQVIIKNQGDVGLAEGELSISFPRGFKLTSIKPEPASQLVSGAVWQIANLKEKSSQEFEFTGQIFGNVGETKDFMAALNYQPVNFSSNFLESTSFKVEIESSILDVSIKTPNEVVEGQVFPLNLKLTNNSDQDLENLKILFLDTEGLEIIQQDDYAVEHGVVSIDKISKNSNQEINLEAKFTQTADTEVILEIETGIQDFNTQEIDIITITNAQLKIIQVALDLNLIVNYKQDTVATVLGEKLNYQLLIDNSGQQDLTDLIVKVDISEISLIDWESLQVESLEEIGDVERDGQLVFNKFQFPELEELTAGDQFEIDFNLNLLKSDQIGEIVASLQKDNQIKLTTQATCTASLKNEDVGGFEITTQPVEIIVNVD
ncbi:MAG: hypothetical protein PHS07_02155 [Patescibacteria group bacterium]|nr:hypothetical protein [Patescibacteria group bacterium]